MDGGKKDEKKEKKGEMYKKEQGKGEEMNNEITAWLTVCTKNTLKLLASGRSSFVLLEHTKY